MRRFVAVDIETTGLKPWEDYIIEVGLAGEDYATKRYFECTFSLPFPLDAMKAEAREVNGWSKRPFPMEVSYDWASAYLVSQLQDAHIVGKNPQFDTDFLKSFLEQCGLPGAVPWHHRLVDVGTLAWGSHASAMGFGPQNGNHWYALPPNTDDVEKMVGIPRELMSSFPNLKGMYHTAQFDARWAWQVFRSIVPEVEQGT